MKLRRTSLFGFVLSLLWLPNAIAQTENLAPRGFANQTSEYNQVVFPAFLAINGIYTDFTHTSGEPSATWLLNLGGAYRIESVEIYNRADCCADRLIDVTVSLFDSDGQTIVHEEQFPLGAAQPGFQQIVINPPVTGQYLRIRRGTPINGEQILSLAEVNVIGSPALQTAPGRLTPGGVGNAGSWSVLQVTDSLPITNHFSALMGLNGSGGLRDEKEFPVLNFYGSGEHGHFPNNESTFLASAITPNPFPVRDLMLAARSHVKIPEGEGGNYTFGIWADDSHQLFVDGKLVSWSEGTNANFVVLPVANYGNPNTYLPVMTNYIKGAYFSSVSLSPGIHSLELIYFQKTAECQLELSAVKGVKTAFDASFRLVGDKAAGGLELVKGEALVMTQSPSDRVVTAGEPLLLEGEAKGTPPITYQWFKNDQLLPGMTGSIFAVDTAAVENAGRYHLVARNFLGEVMSGSAQVEVKVGVVDLDFDGLGDDWEQTHFGDPSIQDGTGDPDLDGSSNLNEYRADTLPTDPASFPRIVAVRRADRMPEVEWIGGEGSVHVVERSQSLTEPVWEEVHRRDLPESPLKWQDPAPSTTTPNFYRVRFQRKE